MSHDFSSVSHTQFETLSADLIGRDLNVRFEQFGVGPDGGIDGRYVKGPDVTILQAKNYGGSEFSDLKRVLQKERAKIDKLALNRYILSTSVSMTATRKAVLMEIIGPSLLTPSDIYGKEDLEALLRSYPDVLEAHPELWPTNAAVLERVLNRTLDERNRRSQPPAVLSALLPRVSSESAGAVNNLRDILFLLGARPADDQFILWLGPKLEAHGYQVFSEIMTLEPGDRWRKEVYRALEHRAAKVLVPANSVTRQDEGLMDLLDKAREIGTAIEDPRFVIPLRMNEGSKIEGLRDAVPVDFANGWGKGLERLLESLRRQKVPHMAHAGVVAPQWDQFRTLRGVSLLQEPEPLTSNWISVVEMPDNIHYYEAVGSLREVALKNQVARLSYPAVIHGRGLITFADPMDIQDSFEGVASLRLMASMPVTKFVETGMAGADIKAREASNKMTELINKAWEQYCKNKGMIAYAYSNSQGFHISADQVANGFRVPWGKQGGGRRSSMLRNVARKHVWKYGVTAIPRLWPFWHIRLKARVLFAEDNGTAEGKTIDDSKKMHRLRRTGCKGWRNKQWHGRLLAFLEIMSAGSAFIRVPLAPGHDILLSSEPILFTSPVSTSLPDVSDADGEEVDDSTLGRPEAEEEDA